MLCIVPCLSSQWSGGGVICDPLLLKLKRFSSESATVQNKHTQTWYSCTLVVVVLRRMLFRQFVTYF